MAPARCELRGVPGQEVDGEDETLVVTLEKDAARYYGGANADLRYGSLGALSGGRRPGGRLYPGSHPVSTPSASE